MLLLLLFIFRLRADFLWLLFDSSFWLQINHVSSSTLLIYIRTRWMRPLNAPTEPYHFVCLITVKPALLDSSFFVRSLLAQLELRDNRFRTITTLSTTSKARDSSRKTAICNMYWPAPSTCYIQIERNDRNENVWKLNARGDENENGKKGFSPYRTSLCECQSGKFTLESFYFD